MKRKIRLCSIAVFILAFTALALTGCAAEYNDTPDIQEAVTLPAELEPEEIEAEEPEPEEAEEPEEPEAEEPEEPEAGPAPEISTPQVPVDLQPLLHRNFDEVRHLFGNETRSEPGVITYRIYSFDTGLRVSINDNGDIASIFIEYERTSDRTAHHLSGIDGTSTYDDVTAMFGSQPYNTRTASDGAQVSTVAAVVEDYGYWIGEGSFAWFSFDTNDNVVAILFFCAFIN